jgi:hypothetical protein
MMGYGRVLQRQTDRQKDKGRWTDQLRAIKHRQEEREKEQGILKGKYHCTVDLLFDWFGISCMTADNFCYICKTD